MSKQVKSKHRVENFGEVFTAEREVKAMCDLVAEECDRIDSRFLEPACGNGNFLSEILSRKLATVSKFYKNNPYDFERYSVLAVSSLYAVDILFDNVIECRERLYKIWENKYKSVCKGNVNSDTLKSIRYILEKNILCGNALTLMCVDKNQQDTDTPIIFPEWSLLLETKLKRRDFRLDVLLKANEKPNSKIGISNGQMSFLEKEDYAEQYLALNPSTGEYMPEPVKDYPPVHFGSVYKNG